MSKINVSRVNSTLFEQYDNQEMKTDFNIQQHQVSFAETIVLDAHKEIWTEKEF